MRERVIEFGRSGGGDSRDPRDRPVPAGLPREHAVPVVSEGEWASRTNVQCQPYLPSHPEAGEIEQLTYIKAVEAGITPSICTSKRVSRSIVLVARSVPQRSSSARTCGGLRPGGKVKFQVQFGEYGGSYVNHCHNTVHERLRHAAALPDPGQRGTPQLYVTPTT